MTNLLKEIKSIRNYFPEFILSSIFILFTFTILDFEKNFINYTFAENLINYEGGFVRRGLFGSLAYFFYETFDINPKIFFTSVYYFFYFILILIFIYLINSLKKENFYLAILIIISPATFLFLIFDNGAIFRKEIFFIVIFLLHVVFAKKTLEKNFSFDNYFKFNLFFIYPILFFNILIHEFQFFLLFFHYLMNLYIFKSLRKNTSNLKYFYVFFTLVFFITINSGNQNTVMNIERSLEVFIPNITNDYGPTDMLNGNINLVIGSFLKMFIASNFFEFFQVFLMLFFSVLLFLLIFNRFIEKNKLNLYYFKYYNSILLTFTFVIIFIFILTAFDYGRLFHIITMHIIGFYLVLPSKVFKFHTKSFSLKFKIQLSIFIYFLFFSMPSAHILMGKGSMYLNNGSGLINYLILNFEPLIQRILL